MAPEGHETLESPAPANQSGQNSAKKQMEIKLRPCQEKPIFKGKRLKTMDVARVYSVPDSVQQFAVSLGFPECPQTSVLDSYIF